MATGRQTAARMSTPRLALFMLFDLALVAMATWVGVRNSLTGSVSDFTWGALVVLVVAVVALLIPPTLPQALAELRFRLALSKDFWTRSKKVNLGLNLLGTVAFGAILAVDLTVNAGSSWLFWDSFMVTLFVTAAIAECLPDRLSTTLFRESTAFLAGVVAFLAFAWFLIMASDVWEVLLAAGIAVIALVTLAASGRRLLVIWKARRTPRDTGTVSEQR